MVSATLLTCLYTTNYCTFQSRHLILGLVHCLGGHECSARVLSMDNILGRLIHFVKEAKTFTAVLKAKITLQCISIMLF